MDLMEIKEKETLGREEAAARLHDLADALAKDNEVEIEDDERELEVELKW